MRFVGSSGCRIRILVKTSNEGSLEVRKGEGHFLGGGHFLVKKYGWESTSHGRSLEVSAWKITF